MNQMLILIKNRLKENRYRCRPWASDGIQVFLKDCLRPVDRNPVWIPTNPITFFLLLLSFPSPTFKTRPFWLLLLLPLSHITFTDLDLLVRHLYCWLGWRSETSPKMNPERPNRRQNPTSKTVGLTVEGGWRAWKSLGDEGIVLLFQIEGETLENLGFVEVLQEKGTAIGGRERELWVWADASVIGRYCYWSAVWITEISILKGQLHFLFYF